MKNNSKEEQIYGLKYFIRFIFAISLLTYIGSIDFGITTGYFKSDIKTYQSHLNVYSKYIAGIFMLVSFIFLIIKERKEKKFKSSKSKSNIISPEFLKHTFLILFFTLIIWVNFDKLATNFSLIINKQKQISSVEKVFKIYFYDEKTQELRLIIDHLEFVKMRKNTFDSLENKQNIALKFKVGLLHIPFDPEYKK